MINGFFNIALTLKLVDLLGLWSQLLNGICSQVVVGEILVLKYSPNLGSTEYVATKMNNNQPLRKITFIYMKQAHESHVFYFRNFFTEWN